MEHSPPVKFGVASSASAIEKSADKGMEKRREFLPALMPGH